MSAPNETTPAGTGVPTREALGNKIAAAITDYVRPRAWALDATAAVLAVLSEEIGYNAADRTWRADADTQQHIADLVAERDTAREDLAQAQARIDHVYVQLTTRLRALDSPLSYANERQTIEFVRAALTSAPASPSKVEGQDR